MGWGRSKEELHFLPLFPHFVSLGIECGIENIRLSAAARTTCQSARKLRRRVGRLSAERRELGILMFHQPPLPATTNQLDFRRHATHCVFRSDVYPLSIKRQACQLSLLVRFLGMFCSAAAVRYHDLTFEMSLLLMSLWGQRVTRIAMHGPGVLSFSQQPRS